MASFRFTAAKQNGKFQEGTLEASSAAAAKLELRSRGLTLVSLEEARPQRTASSQGFFANLTRPKARLSTKSLAVISRQLSTLLNARLRVDEALAAVASGHNAKTAALLLDVRTQVQEGKTFAQALKSFPQSFPQLYVESITAGEQAGDVGKVMEQLAQYLEARVQNGQTVKLALIYPCLLAVVSFLIITVLLVFVVPDIVRVFTERGTELPFLTRALIGTSSFLAQWGAWLLGGLTVTLLLVSQWQKKPDNRLRLDKRIATSKLSAKLSQAINGAQLCSILSTLLGSGVPLVEALRVAAVTLPNRFFKENAELVADKVRKGESFSKAMREVQVFSPLLVAMVTSGETSGRLAQTLEHSAKEQQKSLEALVKTVVGLVEPAILLVMGGIVLLMVLAILLPIISMNTTSGL